MPRSARLDLPGLTHHVINRGIERGLIFKDDTDRYDFLSRISKLAGADQTQVYAFCLMPNHFHLLIRTLAMPLSVFMSRLLTGYSVYFNKRHKRAGHLFQNRFKSFVVDEESYLLELIRYIHLNPIRAKIINDLPALDSWPFSGHATLMGKIKNSWLDTDEALSHLSSTLGPARNLLKEFMVDGLTMEQEPNLDGGGLKRSLVLGQVDSKDNKSYDERILGDSEFVAHVLARLEKVPKRRSPVSLQDLIIKVADHFNLTTSELCSGSKRRAIVQARAVVIWLGTKALGLKADELAEALYVKPTTICMSLLSKKGEHDSEPISQSI